MFKKSYFPLHNVKNLSSYENVDAMYHLVNNKVISFKVGEDVDAYHHISSIGHNTNDKGVVGFIIGISNKVNGKFTGHYACKIVW